jgi:hypothetical protein
MKVFKCSRSWKRCLGKGSKELEGFEDDSVKPDSVYK